MFRWLLHVTGSDNVSGRWYGFWSGFGGDLSLFAAGAAFLRHKNCHVKWCWRIGRLQAGRHTVCRRHHPDAAPTHQDVLNG